MKEHVVQMRETWDIYKSLVDISQRRRSIMKQAEMGR